MRFLAIAFAVLLLALSPVGNGGSSGVFGNRPIGNMVAPTPTPSPTPGPPTALLAYGYFANTSCQTCGKDPGPVAMKALFIGGETQESSAVDNAAFTSDCPGQTQTPKWATGTGSNCGFYAYQGYFRMICTASGLNGPSYNAWQWAIINGNDENFALHYNSSPPAGYGDGSGKLQSTNRLTHGSEGGQCNNTASNTAPDTSPTPGGSNALLPNPADLTANTCLVAYLTGIGTPCPGWPVGPYLCVSGTNTGCNGALEGLSEDYMWWNYSANYYQSEELGNTVAYAKPQNTYGLSISELAAFAQFYNNLCTLSSICIPVVAKSITGGINFCETTTVPAGVTITDGNPHCFPSNVGYSDDTIDGRLRTEEFCNALTGGNFKAFLLENPVDRTAAGNNYVVLVLNTAYYDLANNICPGIKFFAEEGTQGYYSEAMGVAWMITSSDGTPDVYYPWRHVANNTNTQTDVPYWFDEELVPQGAEQATTAFSFGGTAPDYADGCQSATPDVAPNWPSLDAGGLANVTVWCAGQDLPVLVKQYQHSHILGGPDLGPVAVVVNTSTTTDESIQSSWFGPSAPGGGDPASTYKHVIGYAQCGGEMCEGAYIPTGYNGDLLQALQDVNTNCTDTTYCLPAGSVSTALNMTSAVFSPASAPSNCTDGSSCVRKHSAVFLTSQ